MQEVNVAIKILHHKAKLPKYGSAEAAGADLHAVVDDGQEGYIIRPGYRGVIPCGFAMELPVGYEAQVRPRSGLALKVGITVVNTPGTIDSDYRGEVMVILINHGIEDFVIKSGDRIAQMVIAPVTRGAFSFADELNSTDRGVRGFGSTGL